MAIGYVCLHSAVFQTGLLFKGFIIIIIITKEFQRVGVHI